MQEHKSNQLIDAKIEGENPFGLIYAEYNNITSTGFKRSEQ